MPPSSLEKRKKECEAVTESECLQAMHLLVLRILMRTMAAPGLQCLYQLSVATTVRDQHQVLLPMSWTMDKI
ncbi:hypothetical protein Bca4012_017208 [Brassica carinata]